MMAANLQLFLQASKPISSKRTPSCFLWAERQPMQTIVFQLYNCCHFSVYLRI
jgi:hypothetical protein